MATSVDISFVNETVARLGSEPDKLIPLLQALQVHYGWLPPEALEQLATVSGIAPAEISGVATFYNMFRLKPVGKHLVRICVGTACHVKGSPLVYDALARELKLGAGQDTDAAGLFTLEKVACLGCCTLAPAVQIDCVTYGYVTPDRVGRILQDFLSRPETGAGSGEKAPAADEAPHGAEIRVGMGSCCVAKGSAGLFEALQQLVAEAELPVTVRRVGCVGMCHQTPLVEVLLPGHSPQLYAKVTIDDAAAIVQRHFRPKRLLRRFGDAVNTLLDRVSTDQGWTPVSRYAIDYRDPPVAAFAGLQQHLSTEFCGSLDPLDSEDYLRRGGFGALRRCLTQLAPEQVIAEIKHSGLRGRGGAGYPSGTKWAHVRAAPGTAKYLICNGDEGDPGAFMDRMLLESFPHRVIEGMAIAAYAIGCREGYFYIRAEYPLAVRRIREALAQCEVRGLLSGNSGGNGFHLELKIMEGAGAFVCGEETALIASLEGHRGNPRLRPPYPAEQGLHGCPTLVSNVETFALVPWIMNHGAAAFASHGTAGSKGTKVFALAGKVARGGLIEVPMGITLHQIVEEIGGGVANGKRLKAVQVGGPSGGCVPAHLMDTPVDYEALTAAGAIMGSGGLVVLDEADCMVEMARYFLQFTQDQSCGKCTFCRIGTKRLLEILERICAGKGQPRDLEELERLGEMVKRGSLCALGGTAPNPVLSTLKHFREEYEAHLQGRCHAGRCRGLITYTITDACIGCTRCAQICPADAIAFTPHEKHVIDQGKCIRCNSCRSVCPVDAVKVT